MTLGVKLPLHPLTRQALIVRKVLQAGEPQLAALREKYRHDSSARRRELGNFYRPHRINLSLLIVPLLLQIPVLWALFILFYRVALGGEKFLGVPLGQVPSFLAIAREPILAMFPLLVGLATYLQQKLMSGGETRSSTLLAVFEAYLAMQVPVVLSIYWIVSAAEDLLEGSVVMGRGR
jgi:YidC/Oxa1 family membrane protein insertase